ncbi:MAG: thiamine-phosphate kinase, partial [Elusimicrobia bacterium]|nr:thiamine-phosphate kinase [Elusimicrobiota bacterium]
LYCCIGLGLPPDTSLENLNNFYDGLIRLAKKHNINIIGGDTNSSPLWVISITLIGTVQKNKIVRRSGAKPGEYIYITGNMGDSSAGLEILQKGKNNFRDTPLFKHLIRKHFYPPVKLKQAKAVSRIATSMIDSSDGLFSSIEQLCKASGAGAEIYADNIPVSKQLRAYSKNFTRAMDFALYGGEDYELVFTSGQQKIPAGQRVFRVGRITKTKGIRLYSGSGGKNKKELEIKKTGFEHFRNPAYQFSS